MDRKNIENIYPLSPMQQGILFHSLLAPDAGAYVPQVSMTIEGLTDVVAFQKAWEEVFEQHSPLRTAFRWEKRDQPFQVVYRVLELPWSQQDWRECSPAQQPQKLNSFLEEDRRCGFDLKVPPLFRITLIRLAETRYQLIWTQHHIIIDGWSSGLILQEVFARYQASSEGRRITGLNEELFLPKLGSRGESNGARLNYSRPYADYIAWLEQQDLLAAEKFWRQQLQGFTAPNALQVNQLSSSSPRWQEQEMALSASNTNALQTLAKTHQFTLNTLIQGAFAILLSRYCNQDDIVFGATSSGRPATLTGAESMVGLFINTLPVRVQVNPQALLIPWLQHLQAQQLEALQYEYAPLQDIQSWSQIPHGAALFEQILVFENYPIDVSVLQSHAELKVEAVRSQEWTSFPLTVLVSAATELTVKLKYDANRFASSTLANFLVHFCTLLEGIAECWQEKPAISDLPLLTESEQQLLAQWNTTEAEYPQQCLHELFEAQVNRTPKATAVIFAQEHLTYSELNAKANQLAHYLRTVSVQPEVLVGICLERSLEMVIGLLAILKAGGAYVPLDPDYPQARLTLIQEEAQLKTILTQDKIREVISNSHFPHSNPVNTTFPENSIYVIYTSGSTGKPKGVINTHRGIVNRLCWMQQAYHLTTDDRVLQKTPFSFDVSVWEFFWTLLTGATLIVAQPGGHKDSQYLVELIKTQKITTLHFVPSMLEVFLETPHVETCTSLKRVICSGEALSTEQQNRFFTRLEAQVHNLYGPTEAAIDVTYFDGRSKDRESQRTVPIGSPIHNTQIYLLDSHLRPVPIGVAGELYVGGDSLARGYLKQPELTAEKFIPNPFGEGTRHKEEGRRENPFNFSPNPKTLPPTPLLVSLPNHTLHPKLYKTGDLARYLPDGNLEYLGRLDNQVKIRGFRIELGEIEAVLSQHPEVKTAVAIAKPYPPNNNRLVAYVVPTHKEASRQNWRSFLEAKLPSYLMPYAFVILESIPLTPNGKIDRRALLAIEERGSLAPTQVQPRNSTEEIIATIWKEVLKLEQVGIYDNFFDLGGNSLLATRINSRLRQAFALDLPLRSLFEKLTIAAIAEHIQALQMTIEQLQTPKVPSPRRKEIEL